METITPNQGNFDVLSFIQASNYPTETVVVFQDVASADKYIKLVEKRAQGELADAKHEATDVVMTDLDKEIEELGNKIRNSSIVFELRGMPPGIVNKIMDIPKDEEADDVKADQARDNELIAKSIISVKNHEGVADPRVWEAEHVQQLRDFLKEGEFSKLVKGVSMVNFNAAVFDQATDAGFSSGSSDLA